MRVRKIDHHDAHTRERLVEFLAPFEPHALFILGNLTSGLPDSHLYAAVEGQRWLGVAGYYGGPKALVPFSTRPQAVRKLVRHVVPLHANIDYVNGIDYAAEPAYREIEALGFAFLDNPPLTFMELDGPPPPQEYEELCRPMRPEDIPHVARLMRHLRNEVPIDAPVSESELASARIARLRHVLEWRGQVVSMASTNGMGISAFQILGVATAKAERSRGFARAVCASLIRDMIRQGATKTVLFTGLDNVAAQRCYLRLGFKVTGRFCVARVRRSG